MKTKNIRVHSRLGCPLELIHLGKSVLERYEAAMSKEGMTAEEYRQAVGNYGMPSGHFTVVEFPSDAIAVRVSFLLDDACRGYHRMILSGQVAGPMIPQVHCTISRGDLFITVMKRYKATVGAVIDDVWQAVHPVSEPIAAAIACLTGTEFIASLCDAATYRNIHTLLTCGEGRLGDMADPAWVDALQIICQSGLGRLDIHGENIMVDEAGNFILTDPVSFRR